MAFTMRVPRTTLHAWILKGIDLIDGIVDKLVLWPDARQSAVNAAEFLSVSDINGVIGAVDCSHVAIMPRESERIAYTNRKCFYSIHLLAVVDARGRFVYVDVGCAGSMADTTVLRTSSLATAQVIKSRANATPPIRYGFFLLADAGFASLPWVVQNYTAIQCQKSPGCRKFNHCIGRGRGIVERAYGMLKMRFKRIGGRSSFDRKEQVSRFVRVCCALHNLAIDMESTLFQAQRVRGNVEVGAATAGVAAAQFAGRAPASGSRIGADRATREAGYRVRQIVANDTLLRRGYSLEALY